MHEAIGTKLARHIAVEADRDDAVHIGCAAAGFFDNDFGGRYIVAGWSAENTCGKFSRSDKGGEIMNRETRND